MKIGDRIASEKVCQKPAGNSRYGHREILSHVIYCKTLNVCMPIISRISHAKQNHEIEGREYQMQAKK